MSADPLTGPLLSGTLPQGFDANTVLTGIQSLRPIDPARSEVPGTIDFMRSKIKHVAERRQRRLPLRHHGRAGADHPGLAVDPGADRLPVAEPVAHDAPSFMAALPH